MRRASTQQGTERLKVLKLLRLIEVEHLDALSLPQGYAELFLEQRFTFLHSAVERNLDANTGTDFEFEADFPIAVVTDRGTLYQA